MDLNVVAIWEAFYIENKRFDLDTLRVPNRSPTPISKSNDFRRPSEHIWGARGTQFQPILEVLGVRAGQKNIYFLVWGPGVTISSRFWRSWVRAGQKTHSAPLFELGVFKRVLGPTLANNRTKTAKH